MVTVADGSSLSTGARVRAANGARRSSPEVPVQLDGAMARAPCQMRPLTIHDLRCADRASRAPSAGHPSTAGERRSGRHPGRSWSFPRTVTRVDARYPPAGKSTCHPWAPCADQRRRADPTPSSPPGRRRCPRVRPGRGDRGSPAGTVRRNAGSDRGPPMTTPGAPAGNPRARARCPNLWRVRGVAAVVREPGVGRVAVVPSSPVGIVVPGAWGRRRGGRGRTYTIHSGPSVPARGRPAPAPAHRPWASRRPQAPPARRALLPTGPRPRASCFHRRQRRMIA